eukprot:scaffold34895_cov34-Cyclotella_meneghiniana.AAC.2
MDVHPQLSERDDGCIHPRRGCFAGYLYSLQALNRVWDAFISVEMTRTWRLHVIQYIWVQEWRAHLNTLPIVIVTFEINCWGEMRPIHLVTFVRRFCDVIVK